MAIDQALTILSWQENLPSKDIPPEWMWEDTEALNDWFKALRENQDEPPVEKWKSEDAERSERQSERRDRDARSDSGRESGGDDDHRSDGTVRSLKEGASGKQAGMVQNDLARMFRDR